MRYVCTEPRVPRPRVRGLAKRSGPTATPAFEPAFELCREMPSLSSSSASKFFFQRFFIAPTGVRLRRWLDKHYTDYHYRNLFIYIMDDTINNSQGRLSCCCVQTR